ncbi:hypothetical protein [Dongia deserti]|uniref:hypothetical protein n=1 Tax=Dongia deserti TaxID=2268030 RepID=UPI0013C48177|nr:hypothetical protein [Dongia deserti]
MRVTTEAAVACVHTIYALFERVFAPRCAPVLSHIAEPGGSELNGVCYMWRDIISLRSETGDDRRGRIGEAVDTVIRRTLALPNIACQESALHGVGHGCGRSDVVDQYLAANPNLPPALRAYALDARAGRVP